MKKFLALFCCAAVTFLASCSENRQADLRTASGKFSPYQHVETVTVVPNETFDKCTQDDISRIPDYSRLPAILPKLLESLDNPYTLNRLEGGNPSPALDPSRIKTSVIANPPLPGELQIHVNLKHSCAGDEPYLSLSWRTMRDSSYNAYESSNSDQWKYMIGSMKSDRVPYSRGREQIEKVVGANAFKRHEMDSCSALKESSGGAKTRVICEESE